MARNRKQSVDIDEETRAALAFLRAEYPTNWQNVILLAWMRGDVLLIGPVLY